MSNDKKIPKFAKNPKNKLFEKVREEDVDNVWFRTCEAVQVRRVQVLELAQAVLEE